jgi:hypothetical protein
MMHIFIFWNIAVQNAFVCHSNGIESLNLTVKLK